MTASAAVDSAPRNSPDVIVRADIDTLDGSLAQQLESEIMDLAAESLLVDEDALTVTISFDYFDNFWSAKMGGRVSSCQGTPVLFFEPSGVVFGGGAQLEVRVPCALKLGTDEEVSRLLKLFSTTTAFEEDVEDMRRRRAGASDCLAYPPPAETHWDEAPIGSGVSFISNAGISTVDASRSIEVFAQLKHSIVCGSSREGALNAGEKESYTDSRTFTGAQPCTAVCELRLKNLSAVFVAITDHGADSLADVPKIQLLYSQPLDRGAILDYQLYLNAVKTALEGSNRQLRFQFDNFTADNFESVADFSSLIVHLLAPIDLASGMIAMQTRGWEGEVLTRDAFETKLNTCWGISQLRHCLRLDSLPYSSTSKRDLQAKLVKLVTCYARAAADLLVGQGVPHIITIKESESKPKEEICQIFTKVFYDQLLSFHSVRQAFDSAVEEIGERFKGFTLLPEHGDHSRSIFDGNQPRIGSYVDCTPFSCEVYSTKLAPQVRSTSTAYCY